MIGSLTVPVWTIPAIRPATAAQLIPPQPQMGQFSFPLVEMPFCYRPQPTRFVPTLWRAGPRQLPYPEPDGDRDRPAPDRSRNPRRDPSPPPDWDRGGRNRPAPRPDRGHGDWPDDDGHGGGDGGGGDGGGWPPAEAPTTDWP